MDLYISQGYSILDPEGGGRNGNEKQKCGRLFNEKNEGGAAKKYGKGFRVWRNFPFRPPQDLKWNNPQIDRFTCMVERNS